MISRRSLLAGSLAAPSLLAASKTQVVVQKEKFLINGKVTYAGRTWQGLKIEGLLMNTRMVQGIFDDENPETVQRWKYPDTGKWDAERNTREFIAAMPEWRKHGVLSFTICLQGGSPEGYSKLQPWHNSAIKPDGSLKPAYMARLERILNRADELGMTPIVGIFYFGQDQRLADEKAVKQAVTNTVNWIFDRGYRHVLLEIANESNNRGYDHPIIKGERIHELIVQAKEMHRGPLRLFTGTSFNGNTLPPHEVVKVSDFVLLHGNGVKDPNRIKEMVDQVRQMPTYRPMPILFNEDDHFDFDKPLNNMRKALEAYASWGYFDPGKNDYDDGYQCSPVKWGLNTERKKQFFAFAKEVTGV